MTKNSRAREVAIQIANEVFGLTPRERTNEPTRSPQEPVVQQSATADSEQTGVVVQGSMDEPDRKALSVQQSAMAVDRLIICATRGR